MPLPLRLVVPTAEIGDCRARPAKPRLSRIGSTSQCGDPIFTNFADGAYVLAKDDDGEFRPCISEKVRVLRLTAAPRRHLHRSRTSCSTPSSCAAALVIPASFSRQPLCEKVEA
jgi:hypothetical protein